MTMPQNPLHVLQSFGQSVWVDFIERGFVREGGLAALIRSDGVSGVTSNPAIFRQAIVDHTAYRESIDALARQGLAAHEIHEALMIDDIREAAGMLTDVFERTEGRDGYVSLEVSPHLARDTEETYWEAKRLWTLVDRPNVMIKVPGTIEGIPAIRRLIADEVNVNVTLLFSVERYAAVTNAFAEGMSDRAARNLPLERVASVASFFLSRIDSLIDAKLDAAKTNQQAPALRGKCAVACARAAHRHYRASLESARWRMLHARGARPQKLLWASTGTKDPTYSDVKYVDALIGPDTVTTLPLETLVAYRDHGRPTLRLLDEPDESELTTADMVEQLLEAGIDWQIAASELEADGVRKFVSPHQAVLAALRKFIAASSK